MSSKVFVGGIPFSADDSDLEMAFSHFGTVKQAKVITDRDTGQSRGFGFVTFDTEQEAQEAISIGTLDMDGRKVRIDAANDDDRGGRRGGGGGGGRGRGRR